MIDILPDEILSIIIFKTCRLPSDFIKLKGVNKQIYNFINNKKNIFKDIENYYEKDINNYCNIYTPIKTFIWFFENDVNFTLLNIKQLIIHDRHDVFKKGYFYKQFLDIIFNRFHISLENYQDIFSLVESYNPLIIAGNYNRITIIKLLLEQSTVGNNYIKLIPDLFDISIKYNHKRLLTYLIVKHYDKIKELIDNKLLQIIYRINNCEDILFYLYKIKKVTFYSKHYQGIIINKYNDFFIEITKTTRFNDDFSKTLLSNCIHCNNQVIFDYLFLKLDKKLEDKEFTEMLVNQKNIYEKNEMIRYIIINYHKYLCHKYKIIKLSIINDIKDEIIINLLNNNFYFDDDDIKELIEKKRYNIVKNMCEKLTE